MKKTYQQPTTELLEVEQQEDVLRGSTLDVFAKRVLFIEDFDEPNIVDDVKILDEDDFFDEEDVESLPSFNVWED